ncbi:hypothetical protein ABFS82_13G099500 [Erythranthe guttata]|uniref:TCP domain-containing protein n=1 Tax=Erythranthe guttata TaxID=4155 RepID=A0A022QKF1_ERYGU|nr:PREDICTED: transcription factor TCP3-like [Erythranthe guttata]EYU28054.1 hypothetical protein MIMGU_mgv1a011793mg [Erythranthe guttata]|eukprot:XP_012848535.1 PREDICTED: transcription factor TCP3-like [Erythranthe guttata]
METTTRNKHNTNAFQESPHHQQDFSISSLSGGAGVHTPDRIMQVGFTSASSSRKRKKPAADVIQVRSGGGGGRKDKHSKVCTASGTTRDRRLRLSPKTAIQFYDVQDRLGYDRPSKAVDWLMNEAKSAIDALLLHPPPPPPPVPLPPPHDIYDNPVYSFDCFPPLSSSSCCSEFQVLPIVDETREEDSVLEHIYHHHQAFYTWNHNNSRSQISDRETMFSTQREPLQSIHNYPIITPNYSPPFPGIFNNNSSNSIQELLHMPNSFLHFQD